MKLIIDTDGGVDDAMAITMVLKHYSGTVVGITTVSGNVELEQATCNTLRVLQAHDRVDIPIFKGCVCGLLDRHVIRLGYHGTDGLCDVSHEESLDNHHVIDRSTPAAVAIVNLINKHDGDIELLCLGPLTNIAVAIALDASMSDKLRRCVVMGGSYGGIGNVTSTAEFNFHSDAEAAEIVLSRLHCPTVIASWDLSVNHTVSVAKARRELNFAADGCTASKLTRFHDKIVGATLAKIDDDKFVFCDEFAAAILIDPDIVLSSCDCRGHIELTGDRTRGMMVLYENDSTKRRALNVVKEVNFEKLLTLIRSCFSS